MGWQWHHLLTYLEVTHLLTAPGKSQGFNILDLVRTVYCYTTRWMYLIFWEEDAWMKKFRGWRTTRRVIISQLTDTQRLQYTTSMLWVLSPPRLLVLLRVMPYFSSIILMYTLTKFHKNRSFILQYCVPCSQSVNKSDFSSCHQFIHRQGRILGAPLPCEVLGTCPQTAEGDRRRHSGFNISSLICC